MIPLNLIMNDCQEKKPLADDRQTGSLLESSELSSINTSVIFQPSNFWNGFHKVEPITKRTSTQDSSNQVKNIEIPNIIDKEQIQSQNEKYNLVMSYVEKGVSKPTDFYDFDMRTISSRKVDYDTMRNEEINDELDKEPVGLQFHKKSDSMNYLKTAAYSLGYGNCFFEFQDSKQIIGGPISPKYFPLNEEVEHNFPPRLDIYDRYEREKSESQNTFPFYVENKSPEPESNPNKYHLVSYDIDNKILEEKELNEIKNNQLNMLLSTSNLDLNGKRNLIELKKIEEKRSIVEEEKPIINQYENSLLRPIQNIQEHNGLRLSHNNSEFLAGLKHFQTEYNSNTGKENSASHKSSVQSKMNDRLKSPGFVEENSLHVIEIEDPYAVPHVINDYYSNSSTHKQYYTKSNEIDVLVSEKENIHEREQNQQPLNPTNVRNYIENTRALINRTSIETSNADQVLLEMYNSAQPSVNRNDNIEKKLTKDPLRQTDPVSKKVSKILAEQILNLKIDKNDYLSQCLPQSQALTEKPPLDIQDNDNHKNESNVSKSRLNDSNQTSLSGFKIPAQSILSRSYNIEKEPLFTIEEKVEINHKNSGEKCLTISEESLRTNGSNLTQNFKNNALACKLNVIPADGLNSNRDNTLAQEHPNVVYSNFSLSINIDNNDFLQHLNKFTCWEQNSANELFLENMSREMSKHETPANLSRHYHSTTETSPNIVNPAVVENLNQAVRGTYFDEEVERKRQVTKSFDKILVPLNESGNPFLNENFEPHNSKKYNLSSNLLDSQNNSDFGKKLEANVIVENKLNTELKPDYFTMPVGNKDGKEIVLPFSFIPQDLNEFINEPTEKRTSKSFKFSLSLGDQKVLLPRTSEEILEQPENGNNLHSFRNSKFCNGLYSEPRTLMSNNTKSPFSKVDCISVISEAGKEGYMTEQKNKIKNMEMPNKTVPRPFQANDDDKVINSNQDKNDTVQNKANGLSKLPKIRSEDNIPTFIKENLNIRYPNSVNFSKSPIEILWQSIQFDNRNKNKSNKTNVLSSENGLSQTDGDSYLNELFEKKNQLLSLKSQFLQYSFENQMTEEEKIEFKHAVETIDFEIEEISAKITITMQKIKSSPDHSHKPAKNRLPKNSPKRCSTNKTNIVNRISSNIKKSHLSASRKTTEQSVKISCDKKPKNSATKIATDISKIRPQFNEYFAEQNSNEKKGGSKMYKRNTNSSIQSKEANKSTSLSSQKMYNKFWKPLDSVKTKLIFSTQEKNSSKTKIKSDQITPFKSDDYFSSISQQFKSHNLNSLKQKTGSNQSVDKDNLRFSNNKKYGLFYDQSKTKNELEECTFAPSKIATPIPVVGTFEERNSNWEKSRALRMHNRLSNKLHKQSQDKITFKPEINPLSRMIADQKPENFHDRQRIAFEKRKGFEKPHSVKKIPSTNLPLFEKELREMQTLLEHAKKGLIR